MLIGLSSTIQISYLTLDRLAIDIEASELFMIIFNHETLAHNEAVMLDRGSEPKQGSTGMLERVCGRYAGAGALQAGVDPSPSESAARSPARAPAPGWDLFGRNGRYGRTGFHELQHRAAYRFRAG